MSETLPDFDAWFTAQFGKRPLTIEKEREAVLSRINGEKATCMLCAVAEYDAQRTAALYAWQAREKEGSKQ